MKKLFYNRLLPVFFSAIIIKILTISKVLVWCGLSTFVYKALFTFFMLVTLKLMRKILKGVDGCVKSILWILDTCKAAARTKYPWLLSERIVQIVVKIRIGAPDYVWEWRMRKEMLGKVFLFVMWN